MNETPEKERATADDQIDETTDPIYDERIDGWMNIPDETESEPDDEIEELEAIFEEDDEEINVEELIQELDDVKKQHERLTSEWANYRRRTEENKVNETAEASRRLAEKIIPAIDDMERAIAYTGENGSIGKDGLVAIYKKMLNAFEAEGIVQEKPDDAAFDMEKHQAIEKRAGQPEQEGQIAEVFQPGYIMNNGKIIRPALVAVICAS